MTQPSPELAPQKTPPLDPNLSLIELMQQRPFPMGIPKVDQLKYITDNLVYLVDAILTTQNNKITYLVEALGTKADAERLKNIGEQVDQLLSLLKQRIDQVHHHDEHPTTPPTLKELIAAGRMMVTGTETFDANAVAMLVLREDGLYLYDIEHDDFGLPRYHPFDHEKDKSGLAEVMMDVHHAGGYAQDQLVHVIVHVLSEEPLNENSVRQGAEETQSKQDQ